MRYRSFHFGQITSFFVPIGVENGARRKKMHVLKTAVCHELSPRFSNPEDATSDQNDPLRATVLVSHTEGPEKMPGEERLREKIRKLCLFYHPHVIAKFKLRSNTNRQQAPTILIRSQSLVPWRRRRHPSSSSFIIITDGDASRDLENGD